MGCRAPMWSHNISRVFLVLARSTPVPCHADSCAGCMHAQCHSSIARHMAQGAHCCLACGVHSTEISHLLCSVRGCFVCCLSRQLAAVYGRLLGFFLLCGISGHLFYLVCQGWCVIGGAESWDCDWQVAMWVGHEDAFAWTHDLCSCYMVPHIGMRQHP